MVGVGVNVTLVPVQIVMALAAIDTEGVSELLTVIVTLLEVVVATETQDELLVISQLIISPFAKLGDV